MRSKILCVVVGARESARRGDFHEVKNFHAEAIRLASKIPREDRDWAYSQVDAIGEIVRADREY